MANSTILLFAWAFCFILAIQIPHSLSQLPENHVPFFIFGDSFLDSGNNNYLNGSTKTNFWPYGKTFFRHPTGRFSDGRILPDFIAEFAKLPFIRPYLEPGFNNYTNGVNFASAGAGILPSSFPGTINLKLQVRYFEKVQRQLKVQLGDVDANKLLSKAVYLFSIGSADYSGVSQSTTNQSDVLRNQLMTMVLGNFSSVIKKLHKIGGRKFGFQNLGPIGCMPAAINTSSNATGNCNNIEASKMAKMHNNGLSKLLRKLGKQLLGFKYSLHDLFTLLSERTLDPSKFGFKVGRSACCGSGPYNRESTCGRKNGKVKYRLCINPSDYVWFDAAHPTESANSQLAQLFWNGNPNITGPYNLKMLFEMLET